jgi:UDP-2-acetamido-2,6-beta-L-arabino-hexul-4-ose reductase
MEFKTGYYEKGIIPSFADTFELKLFNTFCCYMDIGKRYPALLTPKSDERGSFVEVVRTGTAGQTSFSTTKPGVTRGNHFHTRKIERFAVISGDAIIQLRRIGTREVFNFTLSGNTPSYVDMPIWFTHNITNTGNGELLTAFWINESFDPTDPDSFSEKV